MYAIVVRGNLKTGGSCGHPYVAAWDTNQQHAEVIRDMVKRYLEQQGAKGVVVTVETEPFKDRTA